MIKIDDSKGASSKCCWSRFWWILRFFGVSFCQKCQRLPNVLGGFIRTFFFNRRVRKFGGFFLLGWWQLQICFWGIFAPEPWGRWTRFDDHIFSDGWQKTTNSSGWVNRRSNKLSSEGQSEAIDLRLDSWFCLGPTAPTHFYNASLIKLIKAILGDWYYPGFFRGDYIGIVCILPNFNCLVVSKSCYSYPYILGEMIQFDGRAWQKHTN